MVTVMESPNWANVPRRPVNRACTFFIGPTQYSGSSAPAGPGDAPPQERAASAAAPATTGHRDSGRMGSPVPPPRSGLEPADDDLDELARPAGQRVHPLGPGR